MLHNKSYQISRNLDQSKFSGNKIVKVVDEPAGLLSQHRVFSFNFLSKIFEIQLFVIFASLFSLISNLFALFYSFAYLNLSLKQPSSTCLYPAAALSLLTPDFRLYWGSIDGQELGFFMFFAFSDRQTYFCPPNIHLISLLDCLLISSKQGT